MNGRDDSRAGRSALIVVVREAERSIGAARAIHDPSAGRGIPAHVAILVPFAPAPTWTDELDARLADVLSRAQPFDATFRRIVRLGSTTLCLVPDSAEPFAAITHAVAAAFPERLPHGDAVTHAFPHITIADGVTSDVLDRLAADHAGLHPFRTAVTEVMRYEEHDGRWFFAARYRLGPPVAPAQGQIVLRGTGAAEVRIGVASYQFAFDERAASSDNSFLIVDVAASEGPEHMRVLDPCLEATDLPRLATAFDSAASGASGQIGGTVEPSLWFVWCPAAGDSAATRIGVVLSLELRPKWVPWTDEPPEGVVEAPGVPVLREPAWAVGCGGHTIQLEMLPCALRAAARDARQLAAAWPVRSTLRS